MMMMSILLRSWTFSSDVGCSIKSCQSSVENLTMPSLTLLLFLGPGARPSQTVAQTRNDNDNSRLLFHRHPVVNLADCTWSNVVPEG